MSGTTNDSLVHPALDSGLAVRLACRSGAYEGNTAVVRAAEVQANLVVLPVAQAGDFLQYCERNPKPCPVLAVSEPGAFGLPTLANDLDLRTDLPRYRVWRDGLLVEEATDVRHLWRDDLVAFAIGCSFTFEAALREEGIALRHVDEGRNVAMYVTSIETVPAGPFHGPMVVSMRPLRPAEAIRAIEITSRYPAVHGSPVHIGLPEVIGIANLSRPDEGDAVAIAADELPVFWACGVTPQAAIRAARVPFAITHAPGAMLVTDRPHRDYAAVPRGMERAGPFLPNKGQHR